MAQARLEGEVTLRTGKFDQGVKKAESGMKRLTKESDTVKSSLVSMGTGLATATNSSDALALSVERLSQSFNIGLSSAIGIGAGLLLKAQFDKAADSINNFSKTASGAMGQGFTNDVASVESAIESLNTEIKKLEQQETEMGLVERVLLGDDASSIVQSLQSQKSALMVVLRDIAEEAARVARQAALDEKLSAIGAKENVAAGLAGQRRQVEEQFAFSQLNPREQMDVRRLQINTLKESLKNTQDIVEVERIKLLLAQRTVDLTKMEIAQRERMEKALEDAFKNGEQPGGPTPLQQTSIIADSLTRLGGGGGVFSGGSTMRVQKDIENNTKKVAENTQRLLERDLGAIYR